MSALRRPPNTHHTLMKASKKKKKKTLNTEIETHKDVDNGRSRVSIGGEEPVDYSDVGATETTGTGAIGFQVL